MALVEQDSGMIYDKTILENIKYGDNTQSFSEEDVYYAARAAKVHSEIMRLPNVSLWNSTFIIFLKKLLFLFLLNVILGCRTIKQKSMI